jgi:leucyl-tRNA synthetase
MIHSTGAAPNITWEKMSKSKHNGIDPSTCIAKYGADAVRAHMLFAAPVGEVLQWDEEKVVGIQRWFGRLQRLGFEIGQLRLDLPKEAQVEVSATQSLSQDEAELLLMGQDTVRAVTKTLESDVYSLNTMISNLMKLTTALSDSVINQSPTRVSVEVFSALLRMLSPVAPAFAEQCWEDAGFHRNCNTTSIFQTLWPEDLLSSEAEVALRSMRKTMTCAVQINGKLRFTTQIPVPRNEQDKESQASRETEILEAVLSTEEGRMWLNEKHEWERRRRVVVVGQGKVLNVVF